MDDFITFAAKKFAVLLQNDAASFQNIHVAKERFDKEISVFSSLSRSIFLQSLQSDLKIQFGPHLERCKKLETCPQHLTFRNINFLISEEFKKETLSSFLKNNSEYDSLIVHYNNKLKTTSSFLDKTKFISQEIDRIKNIFLKPIPITVTQGTLISTFDFSNYSQYAYEWLMSGQDWPLDDILKTARNQYLQNHSQIWNEEEFKVAIYANIKKGVAYVLYEKFLSDQVNNNGLEKGPIITANNLHIGDNYGQLTQVEIPSVDIKHTHKIDVKRKKNLFVLFFSNPWIVTIISGLLIAFLAKYFGWV